MTTYLAKERQNVFVEMEELEKYVSSLIDAQGILGVLSWSACDHEGRNIFVAMKKKEDGAGGNCEAVCGVASNARKGVPRASEAIECRNERHKRLVSMMDLKQNLLRDVPELQENCAKK